jgi:hypothetical protein
MFKTGRSRASSDSLKPWVTGLPKPLGIDLPPGLDPEGLRADATLTDLSKSESDHYEML